MGKTIFEIKAEYTPEDVEDIMYATYTNMLVCAFDSGEREHNLDLSESEEILFDYVSYLVPNLIIAFVDSAISYLPDTLWGKVPHTLPMMLYRVYSVATFLNDRFQGSIIISEDLSGFLYDPEGYHLNNYARLVKTAETLLKESQS